MEGGRAPSHPTVKKRTWPFAGCGNIRTEIITIRVKYLNVILNMENLDFETKYIYKEKACTPMSHLYSTVSGLFSVSVRTFCIDHNKTDISSCTTKPINCTIIFLTR
jgi:hypothetical protein